MGRAVTKGIGTGGKKDRDEEELSLALGVRSPNQSFVNRGVPATNQGRLGNRRIER